MTAKVSAISLRMTAKVSTISLRMTAKVSAISLRMTVPLAHFGLAHITSIVNWLALLHFVQRFFVSHETGLPQNDSKPI